MSPLLQVGLKVIVFVPVKSRPYPYSADYEKRSDVVASVSAKGTKTIVRLEKDPCNYNDSGEATNPPNLKKWRRYFLPESICKG